MKHFSLWPCGSDARCNRAYKTNCQSYLNYKVIETLNNASSRHKNAPWISGIKDGKGKKPEKQKKEERLSIKSAGKLGTDDIGDYKQALDVMTECARILHIRWLQAKLLKELLEVAVK